MQQTKQLQNFVTECLRLYPPFGTLGRVSTKDCEVGGYAIPKNALISVSPLVTQRHPDFWKNPNAFDPRRFEDPAIPMHKFALFPFGGGRHICPAKEFAFWEFAAATTEVLRNTKLESIVQIGDYPEGFFFLDTFAVKAFPLKSV